MGSEKSVLLLLEGIWLKMGMIRTTSPVGSQSLGLGWALGAVAEMPLGLPALHAQVHSRVQVPAVLQLQLPATVHPGRQQKDLSGSFGGNYYK